MRGLLKQLDPDTKMYCDLDRFRASDNPPATVPINLVSTSARPDVVVQEGSRITLLELTVPHNSAESLRAAHRLKQSKANYCCLLGDLERAGFESELVTLEIGSLGHCMESKFGDFPRKAPVRSILDDAAKNAIAGSHQIFLARHEHWNTMD